jgi:hypothetical protein
VSRSSCKLRSLGADRCAPIEAFEQHRKLRRCQCRCRAGAPCEGDISSADALKISRFVERVTFLVAEHER